MTLNKISINDTTTVNTGIVYDISKAHSGSTYTDLTDALGTDGKNVPLEVREGGMSVKFIQTSDNKYVKYRLMTHIFSTDGDDWQGVDEQPTVGSDNLVKSGGVADSINQLEKAIDNEAQERAKADEQLNTALSKKFPENIVFEGDLAFVDKNNKTCLEVKDGHIRTKNFDSKKALYSTEVFEGDLAFVDKNNKTCLEVKDGHIRTKNFDSRDFLSQQLSGLKLSIMGDSISTFDGKLVPNSIGLWSYYPKGDVLSWEDTYWGRLIVNDGMILDSNCASNGSLVSGSDDFAMCSDARIDLLGNPDVIIFYGGTNDVATNKAIGTFDYIDYSGKADYFKPAYAYCLQQMKIKYPKAIIVCVLIPDFSGSNNRGMENVYPLMNQGVPTFEYNNVIKELALAYDCILCDIGSSAPYFNRANYYIHDSDGSYVHPNKVRMSKIYEIIKKQL